MFTGNHTPTYSHFDRPLGEGEGTSAIHVPQQERLLPECLGERGYDTPAFVQNRLATTSNALQGFRLLGPESIATVDLRALGRRVGVDLSDRSSRVVAGSMQYLLDAGERFYLLQWVLDPHAVYSPPEELIAEIEVERQRLGRPLSFYTGLGHFNRPEKQLYKLEDELASLSAAERAFVRRLYEKEVEWVDTRVGFLLEALAKSGHQDDTVVVFTSDHGEAFGEHGSYLHGWSLYDETVRVPLIIAGPGVPTGRVVRQAVSTIDLTPTLADLVGADCLEETWGASLKPLFEGGAAEPRPIYLANPGQQPADALVVGSHKLIADTERRVLELYDLEADPGEWSNLAGEREDLVRRLHGQLASIRDADKARRRRVRLMTTEATLEAAEKSIRRELEAIGYLD
jgi:arylsulfatase A-like enzyme